MLTMCRVPLRRHKLRSLLQVRKYCVAATDQGADRDPRFYLVGNEGFVFMRSPRSLLFRAETAVELCNELLLALQNYRREPRRCLAILDGMSCLMCLTLDAAEATRNLHPREEYRSHANSAYDYMQHFVDAVNRNRALYEPVGMLSEPDQWDALTPVEKHLVNTFRDEMQSIGMNESPARFQLVQSLLQKVESMVNANLATADAFEEPESTLNELLATRYELAEVMGYDSYAAWGMRGCVASDPVEIWRILLLLSENLQEGAREEIALLLSARSKVGSMGPNDDALPFLIKDFEQKELMAIYRREHFGSVEREVQEYLSLANVWRGVEMVCRDLFNVELVRTEMAMYEKYDKNLVKFHVKQIGDEGILGTCYADLVQRDDKPPGAGHFTVQVGSGFDSRSTHDLDLVPPEQDKLLPIVIFTCSIEGLYVGEETEDEKDWEKILLTPTESVSLFHEFGHALHSLFGQTEFQVLSGTRSSIDYVEVFSQLMEIYARDYRSLRRWATHHETKIAISRELCDRMNENESCFGCLNQLDEILTACVDLVYHGPRPLTFFSLQHDGRMVPNQVPPGFESPLPLRRFLSDSVSPIEVTELGFARSYPYQHLVSYPASYYSYTYSRILATAIWNKHFEADPFSRSAGLLLRSVMAKGASAPPAFLLSELIDTSPDAVMKEFLSSGSPVNKNATCASA
ncbi:putative mitochondrial intermediate peptidase [Diplonema papillatum]|nr:putative mitochondrial intermediate peptidase [Diplonema papillatum]